MANKKQDNKSWIQKARNKMEKKGTVGSFTRYCGGTVTDACIQRGLKSPDETTRKRAQFAKAMRGIKKAQGGMETLSNVLDAVGTGAILPGTYNQQQAQAQNAAANAAATQGLSPAAAAAMNIGNFGNLAPFLPEGQVPIATGLMPEAEVIADSGATSPQNSFQYTPLNPDVMNAGVEMPSLDNFNLQNFTQGQTPGLLDTAGQAANQAANQGPNVGQFFQNLGGGIEGKITGMTPLGVGLAAGKVFGTLIDKFEDAQGDTTSVGKDASYSFNRALADALQGNFKQAFGGGAEAAKQERLNFAKRQENLATQAGFEQDIRDFANVSQASTATDAAYRTNISNRRSTVAQGGYSTLGLSALSQMGKQNQAYLDRNKAVMDAQNTFDFSDVKDIAKSAQAFLPSMGELNTMGQNAGFGNIIQTVGGAMQGQGGNLDPSAIMGAVQNLMTKEDGGAKNVEPLRNAPAGTEMKLPGGKAVSRGGGVISYIGAPHERGGIKTKTNSGEVIEVEGGEEDVVAVAKNGQPVPYILSDFYKNGQGETPSDMVRNGKSIQDAVKFNEKMASKKGTPYGGPADPTRSPNKYARFGMRKAQAGQPGSAGMQTESDIMKYQGYGQYIDYGGDINRSSWAGVANTDWGQNYGVTADTTQEELQQIYNEQYLPDINAFYDNKDVAIETLQRFTESGDPNADNFVRTFQGLDFSNPDDHAEILRRAKKKSTDGKIGSFHMFGMIDSANPETNLDESDDKTIVEEKREEEGDPITKEEKEKIPGMGYKSEPAVPLLSVAGMAAGLLPMLAPKIPPAELVAGTPGIGKVLQPRVNLRVQEAAAASDFANSSAALERMGNTGAGMYNNLLLKKSQADQRISGQELTANKNLAGQESALNLRASAINKSSGDMAQARNQAAKNRREEFNQEQKRADLNAIRDGIQSAIQGILGYQSEKRLADAIDVYDTRGYDRTLKNYQKKRDKADRRGDTNDPFYGMTDEQLREAAASEIRSRTGYDPTNRVEGIEAIMRQLNMVNQVQSVNQGNQAAQATTRTPQNGGRKYTRRLNKVKRRR